MICNRDVSKRILVVDDEPDAVELVAFNLKAAGFDVITAEDGESALTKARIVEFEDDADDDN